MQPGDQDPFRQLFEPDPINPDTIQLIGELADSLVDAQPAVYERSLAIKWASGENLVYVVQTEDPEDRTNLASRLQVGLISQTEDDYHEFFVVIDSDNKLHQIGSSDNDYVVPCQDTAQILLNNNVLDGPSTVVVKYLQNALLAELTGIREEDHDKHTERASAAARAALDEHLGDKGTYIQQLTTRPADDQVIAVTKRIETSPEADPNGLSTTLNVHLEDDHAGLAYHYEAINGGEPDIQAVSLKELHDEEAAAPGSEEEAVAKFQIELFGSHSDQVNAIVHALLQANLDYYDVFGHPFNMSPGNLQKIGEVTDYYQKDVNKNWVYDELPGFFETEWFMPGDDPDLLVVDIMEKLNCLAETVLPQLYPDGYPPQPNYVHNQNLEERIDKFFSQTSQHAGHTKVFARKRDIVALDDAIYEVLNQLAPTNHPVVQAVSEVYSQHKDSMDAENLHYVINRIVIQTHWPLVRSVLNQQVNNWRHAEITQLATPAPAN